jgi:hypothetical protein
MKFITVGVTNTETRLVNLANVVEVYLAPEGTSSRIRFIDGTILEASHDYSALVQLILETA